MSVEATTRCGRVSGEAREGHVAFRGIPFAKPPVGPLRFRAPEPPEPWSGVREAVAFGASAPQGANSAPGMRSEGPESEDCLYLNVYTPAADGRRRPVLFWIHGGAFTLGSASQPIYDGGALARRGDVVVVTTNYRLGVLGYLYPGAHPELEASANLGQLDQIAALRWVRDNVEAFGGDPDNVTVFGESAGSVATCALLAMPAADGLFRRAIAQSGATAAVTERAAGRLTEALLEHLGLRDARALREVPVSRLIEAQIAVARLDGSTGMALRPTLDPQTLPEDPQAALESGRAPRRPLVIGSNRDEMNLFTMPLLREIDKPMEDTRAVSVLRNVLPKVEDGQLQALLEVYRGSREARGLPHGNRSLISAIQSDLRFRIPSVRFAEASRRHTRETFMYLFTYESPAMRGALRSCHALEIPFVFGTLDAPFQDRFAGTGPAVEALSARMMDSWLSFARDGRPDHPSIGDWIPYDTARRATMVFDRQSGLQDAPFEEERAALQALI